MSDEARTPKSVYDEALRYTISDILEEIAINCMEANKYTALRNVAKGCSCHVDDLASTCNNGVQLCCEFGYASDCTTCKKRDACENRVRGSDYLTWTVDECWEQDIEGEDNGF